MNDWLHNDVLTGLQKLYALRLPNTPPEDAMPATAMVWIEALQHMPIVWVQELDQHRVRQAFRQLLCICDRWPAPKLLLEHLGNRTPQKALPSPPISPEVMAKRRKELREIVSKFKQ